MGRDIVAMMLGLTLGRTSLGEHQSRVGRTTSEGDAAGTFWDWVEAELDRARRYEHALAMLRFPLDRRVLEAYGEWPVGVLRTTDRWCTAGGDLFVLAPETDRDGAHGLGRRLSEAGGRALGPAVVACFPTDALTRHGLEVALGVASSRWVPFPDTSAARAS